MPAVAVPILYVSIFYIFIPYLTYRVEKFLLVGTIYLFYSYDTKYILLLHDACKQNRTRNPAESKNVGYNHCTIMLSVVSRFLTSIFFVAI